MGNGVRKGFMGLSTVDAKKTCLTLVYQNTGKPQILLYLLRSCSFGSPFLRGNIPKR